MHTTLEMNGRARRPAALARGGCRATPRNEKVTENKDQKGRPHSKAPAVMKPSSNPTTPGIKNRSQSRRDRKMALQRDVDKLRKKLRHEENVHRALERAFTRPLGALPRLPPYLPSQTLELLAEVAVLEEEVVRLEEKVVSFRKQGLYEEAVITCLAKNAYFPDGDRCTPARQRPPAHSQSPEVSTSARQGSDEDANLSSLKRVTNIARQTPRRPGLSLSQGDRPGKENQSCATNSCREFTRPPLSSLPKCRMPVAEKCASVQSAGTVEDQHHDFEDKNAIDDADKASTSANRVSEELLTCLMDIFSRMSHGEERAASSPALLRKLSSVDLVGLTHQQRLEFWINTYNACMMNAFLEHGAPTTPAMLVAMMPKATIEHFILRLPYNVNHVNPEGVIKADDVAARGVFGLEWPEPLVTFALSCGIWSSPAVRVYTGARVEEELETAKRDYLQAAVGVSSSSPGGLLAIPKLLHWYLRDFAKDVGSLAGWVRLQLLPRDELQSDDAGRQGPAASRVRVVPYEFRFRYLLASQR